MGQILIGTCSWTDETLIQSGRFYPSHAKDAESRLRYYASQFPIVEVDSSYYAMPAEKMARLWVERTPPEFTFNVKAFRIFTQHQTEPKVLPRDIRDSLPESLKSKKHLYQNHLPSEILDELWSRFESALLPLDSAGKLGAVLFQFPPWFHMSLTSKEYILSCKERMPQYHLAVEFRNASWVNETNAEPTLDFLAENDLAFVAVDEPQGFKSSVPPVVRATSNTAIVRFHGRNHDAWEKPGTKASDRFNYWYQDEELQEWVPRIKELAVNANWVHVLFNTNYQDQGMVNARKIASLLNVGMAIQGQFPLE